MDNKISNNNQSSILRKLVFLYTFILAISVVISVSIIKVNKSVNNIKLASKSENLQTQKEGQTISINNGDSISTTNDNKTSNIIAQPKLTIEEVNKIAANDSRLILVNKDYPLDSTYKPNNLVIPKVKMQGTVAKENRQLKAEAAEALENLFFDAKKDKINLVLVSGYRSFESQADVYEKKVKSDGAAAASKYVAKEGSSEHQTGLAVDINSSPYYDLAEDFEKTKEGKWVAENSYKYGFVIRYLKGKSDITGYNYEPWHLRYVGKEAAKEMFENNLCLEEYLQKLATGQSN